MIAFITIAAEICCYAYTWSLLRLLARSWWRTRELFGGLPLGATWQMLRFLRYSRNLYSETLSSMVVVISVICIWLPQRSNLPRPMIAVLLAMVAQSFFLLFKSLQPPAALFLTSSSPYAADLLVQINIALSPLRCVALLNPKRMHFMQRNALGDNLRTKNPHIWKSIIYRLIEMTPIIILDTRGESAPVMQEAFIMLAPERARKAVFITDENGRAPALEAHGIKPADYALTCVTEEELIPLLRDWTQSAYSLPQPISLRDARHSGSLTLESWETLPAILVIALFDFFDSEAVIKQAAASNQQLLQLWTPLSELEEKDLQWSLEFSWEFVHNPKLALMIFEESTRALIRIDFLLEIAAQVPRQVARGFRRPLTFEQLNQPEPIWSAVWDFLMDLAQQAKERSLQTRFVRH
jgi:hypothetical protein